MFSRRIDFRLSILDAHPPLTVDNHISFKSENNEILIGFDIIVQRIRCISTHPKKFQLKYQVHHNNKGKNMQHQKSSINHQTILQNIRQVYQRHTSKHLFAINDEEIPISDPYSSSLAHSQVSSV